MDTHGHTAIGRVIHELYNGAGEKSERPNQETTSDTDLHKVEPLPDHASLLDVNNIPNRTPDGFLESQLTRNLIQSYRVEFGTNGNGDPTGYGYDILESDHAIKYGNVFRLVVLYKNTYEMKRLRSYVDTITKLTKRYKWFHEVINFVYQRYMSSSENKLCYITFDNYSTDNLHHPRINYDPYDDSLGKLIDSPFYQIVGFDEWRNQMLMEAYYISTELHGKRKWIPWWTYDWKVRYVLKKLIECITAHEEIKVTW